MTDKDETIYKLQDALVQTLGDLTLLNMDDDPRVSELMERIKATVKESGYDRAKR